MSALLVLSTAALFTATVASADAGAVPERGSAGRERRTFAAALAKVRPGMKEEQVLRIVGPPDDVRTETDPGGSLSDDGGKVLRYGTSGHRSCATLGQVYLDRAGVVQFVSGGRGAPPPPDLISEPELTRLLSVLCTVGSYDSGSRFNPLPMIRAVNALHALGRERALAAIGEYLRISSDLNDPAREGMFLVLRTLFDAGPDASGLPRMGVGAPSPAEPKDPRTAPRFPIVIAGDIPLLRVNGYALGGKPEPPEDHLAWFRAHGVLRPGPLRPTDRPLETLDRLLAEHGSDRALPTLFINQFLALLDSVHRGDRGPEGLRFLPGRNFESAWRDLRTRL